MTGTLLHAQDTIYLKNGDEIKAKVLAIRPTEVEYKKADNPDGPTYAIEKYKILMILYADGTKDIFNEPQPAGANEALKSPQQPVTQQQTQGQNRTIQTGTPYAAGVLTADRNESYTGMGFSYLGFEGLDYGFGFHFLGIEPGQVGLGLNMSFGGKEINEFGVTGDFFMANFMLSLTAATKDNFFMYASGGINYIESSTRVRIGNTTTTVDFNDTLGMGEVGMGFYFKPFAVSVGYSLPDFDFDRGGLALSLYIIW